MSIAQLAKLAVIALAAANGSAEPQAIESSRQTPVSEGAHFQSNTHLVVESVVVRAKNGKPIEGLTADDFVISEDNVSQVIRFCEFQKFADVSPAPPPGDADTSPATGSPTVPAEQAVVRYRDRRLLALYFDMSAMPVGDQLRALAAASKFIDTQMSSADLVSLIMFSSGVVKVIQEFTDDRERLNNSLRTLVIGTSRGFERASVADTLSESGTPFGQDDGEFNIFNTDRQLSALQTAVQMLAALKENKSLVYFASGLWLSGVDNQAQMQATVNAAVRANVSLFPVDSRGLVAEAPLGDATARSPGGIGTYSGTSAMAVSVDLSQSQDALFTLAADTGGKALLDYNDLSLGIVQAQKSVSSYYILGYYSTNEALDGKFRRVKVALKEGLSAKLTYREGYYAQKQFSKFTAFDKERQLEEALMLGDPITDLTIQAEVDYFQLNRAEYFVPVAIRIPGRELALARRNGAERTVIDFIGELKDDVGLTVQNVRDKIDIRLAGESASELAKRPIQYDTGFTLLPGLYTLKILARDDTTGRIGTYLAKFVVPNLNAETKRIPISSVILSSQRINLKDALFTVNNKAQEMNPLVKNGLKVIPSVTRVFDLRHELHIYLQAYREATTTSGDVVAFASLYRAHRSAVQTPLVLVSQVQSSGLTAIPLDFTIALGNLACGKYELQVTIIDPTQKRTSFWKTTIAVVP